MVIDQNWAFDILKILVMNLKNHIVLYEGFGVVSNTSPNTSLHVCTNVGWFFEWRINTCQLSTWMCAHLPTNFQKFKKLIYYHNSKTYEKIKEPTKESLIISWFFHEKLQIFKGIQIIRTSCYLIIIYFSNNQNCDSLIWNIFKTKTNVFKKIKEPLNTNLHHTHAQPFLPKFYHNLFSGLNYHLLHVKFMHI